MVGEKEREREFLRLDIFRLCGRNKKVSLIDLILSNEMFTMFR